MAEQTVEYTHDDDVLEGVLVGDAGAAAGAAVLVFPGWEGLTDGVVDVARMVADVGYPAFAVDLYGRGVTGSSSEQCERLMEPFMNDRRFLGDRLARVIDAVGAVDGIDPDRLLAIGFCFGGLCVLDLARANAGVVGVTSFHGVLTAPDDPADSHDGNGLADIDARVLVLHGWDDPLAPPEAVVSFAAEFTSRGADWQLHAFGATMHAFMVLGANEPSAGVAYNERSAGRAWTQFTRFLHECLGLP